MRRDHPGRPGGGSELPGARRLGLRLANLGVRSDAPISEEGGADVPAIWAAG
jgi:hypothetical protein